MHTEVIEFPGELYRTGSKRTVRVEVNWITGCVSFWDDDEKSVANSRDNFEFIFVKRGWFFTDFACRHRQKPLTYRLVFFNRDGDQVKALLDAAARA